MGRIYNILEGWKRFYKEETTAEDKRRANICKECEHATVGTFEKLIKDFELKQVQGLKCDKCGCPLSTKIRAKNAHCPLEKW